MTDKAIKQTRTELISKLESDTIKALAASGVDIDQVIVLSGRDIMKITAIACEKVMEGMVNSLINIVKGEAYTEYIVGQVREELDMDPKKQAILAKEVARISRELDSVKQLLNAEMAEMDRVVTARSQATKQRVYTNIDNSGC
jgi:hypothetical protein